jgi:hypothetical protein
MHLIQPRIRRLDPKVPAGAFRVVVSLCGAGLAMRLGMGAYR